jgi:hypothetical protein
MYLKIVFYMHSLKIQNGRQIVFGVQKWRENVTGPKLSHRWSELAHILAMCAARQYTLEHCVLCAFIKSMMTSKMARKTLLSHAWSDLAQIVTMCARRQHTHTIQSAIVKRAASDFNHFVPTHGWQANEPAFSSAVCRLSVCMSVTYVHCGQTAKIDPWSFAIWQGSHLATSCTKQHRHRSGRFRAVADLVAPPCVPCCKHRLPLQNGAR